MRLKGKEREGGGAEDEKVVEILGKSIQQLKAKEKAQFPTFLLEELLLFDLLL